MEIRAVGRLVLFLCIFALPAFASAVRADDDAERAELTARTAEIIRLLNDRNMDAVLQYADPGIEIDVAGHKGPVKKRETFRWTDLTKFGGELAKHEEFHIDVQSGPQVTSFNADGGTAAVTGGGRIRWQNRNPRGTITARWRRTGDSWKLVYVRIQQH